MATDANPRDASNQPAITTREDKTISVTSDDILIAAPYNAQVNALTKALPGFRHEH